MYCERLVKFLDVTVGIATIATVKSPATNFTPKATIKATSRREMRFYFPTLIF
ncbi:hypothetical protein KEJ47_03310 [Candidatus Bathyarchaeota archaeon]|nr:hypothetical protein [Candidatus Bathyarchaeota archaeon]